MELNNGYITITTPRGVVIKPDSTSPLHHKAVVRFAELHALEAELQLLEVKMILEAMPLVSGLQLGTGDY
ncbi:MAG: hypothetical protein V1767_01105 [Chloroflexota bacterium]